MSPALASTPPISDREADVRRAIEKALNASRLVLVWKNSQYHGQTVHGWIDAGLCDGSADLIGLVIAGPRRGRFFAVEVKLPKVGKRQGGRVSPAQTQWIAKVIANGGYAGVAQTVNEAMEHARRAGEYIG